MRKITRPTSRLVTAAAFLVLTACQSSVTAATDRPTTSAGSPTATAASSPTGPHVDEQEAGCLVTKPARGFAPPAPYPADHPDENLVWFGTNGLWTALALDGEHGPRKGAFWSVNFPGGAEEERPDLRVTWTRLDAEEPVVLDNHDATNAYTVEEGWFMLGGIDPDESGCWRVDASYKGATLSYVYER